MISKNQVCQSNFEGFWFEKLQIGIIPFFLRSINFDNFISFIFIIKLILYYSKLPTGYNFLPEIFYGKNL